MTFTEHTKTINNALQKIIESEFKTPIIYSNEFDAAFNQSELIRLWPREQTLDELTTAGAKYVYSYDLDYYFNLNLIGKYEIEKIIDARIDKLRELLFGNNGSYYDGGSYVWHSLKIESIELDRLDLEDYKLHFARFEITIRRFNQWT